VTVTSRADPAAVKALARAHRWQRLLDDGRYGSISEMAQAEGIERGYLGTVLRLTLLAPAIVQALLDGRAPVDMTLPRLLKPFPTCWAEQGALFGPQPAPGAPAPPGALRGKAGVGAGGIRHAARSDATNRSVT
jgi:hypothetical protein